MHTQFRDDRTWRDLGAQNGG